MSYNGWKNRETWLVNVWCNPNSVADVDMWEIILSDEHDEMPDGVLKDMIDLSQIDWDELRSHFEEDEMDDESKE